MTCIALTVVREIKIIIINVQIIKGYFDQSIVSEHKVWQLSS